MDKTPRANRSKAGESLQLGQLPLEWFTLMLPQTYFGSNWPQALSQSSSVNVGLVSATQTQAGQILELMGRSIQAKVPLMHQALAAARDSNLFESYSKWTGFWLSALSLAQPNTVAMLQIQNRAYSSCFRLLG